MNQEPNQPDNQIDKALENASTTHDAEQHRLHLAEELLRRAGYVPIPNSDQWCLPEDLPGAGHDPA